MKFLLFPFFLVLIIGGCVFLYTWYRLFIQLHFHADNAKRTFPEGIAIPPTEFVTTADGVRIAYQYIPAPEATAVVILIHGYLNPGGKSLMYSHVEFLHQAGYSVATLDLRSHGESEGNKLFMGTKEWQDVEAVYDQLRTRPELEGKKIGYLGVSMGGSTALITAGTTGKGDFVIASVPYANLTSLFDQQIRFNGLRPWMFLPFMKLAALLEFGPGYDDRSARAVVSQINAPILVFSAKHDNQVHPEDAKIIFDATVGPKAYWEADSGHDIFWDRPEEYTRRVLEFLQLHTTD